MPGRGVNAAASGGRLPPANGGVANAAPAKELAKLYAEAGSLVWLYDRQALVALWRAAK